MEKEIPVLKIDDEGKFKYIQIAMVNKEDESDSKILVRGGKRFYYHKYIYLDFLQDYNITNDSKYTYHPLGGGRIEITHNRYIKVYGYSTLYGQCNHAITCAILKQHFPYAKQFEITWSNDGY